MEERKESGGSALGQRSLEQCLRDVSWVAQFLGVSKSWVYQATATGVLPCIRLGATLRFEKGAIEKWLKGESGASVKLPSCR
jgi:excisionase family DNA binding protein